MNPVSHVTYDSRELSINNIRNKTEQIGILGDVDNNILPAEQRNFVS
jgi:hypothetical protein